MSLYTSLIRPVLFRCDAERVHHATVAACGVAGRAPLVPSLVRWCCDVRRPELETRFAGLTLSNPIGLAAGWDKSGRALPLLGSLGFGCVEIGSISARPSQGNPPPRLFRLPADCAIVVNYGLPNDGVEAVALRLAERRCSVPVGVNIVSTNDGPGRPASWDAIQADYVRSLELVDPLADYLVLNLSCPNAEGGHDVFRPRGRVQELLTRLDALPPQRPVFLKVAPDASPAALEQLFAEAAPYSWVRGFVFNLPSGRRDGLQTPRHVWERWPGAVAGRPVEGLLLECLTEAVRRSPRGRFEFIAGGGVFTAEQAYERIRRGASLVQVYTALIYEGPGVVRRINRGLCELLRCDGLRNVSDAVGVDVA